MNNSLDLVYVGSGAVSLIDATYQNLSGRSVSLFERSNFVGGVWAPIYLPGSNIECDYGIHYLLPSTSADKFFQDYFKIEYRVINDQYDVTFLDNQCFSMTKRLQRGRYFKSGSFGLMEGIKNISSLSNLSIQLNTCINTLHIDTNENLCRIGLSDERTFTCNNVVFSSGSKIPNIFVNDVRLEWDVAEKIRIRPQLYLQLKDTLYQGVQQAILKNHEQIKYIHDVTDYSKGLPENNRLYIISFHIMGHGSEQLVLKVMKDLGIIEKCAKLVYAYAFAPLLSNYSAEDLKKFSQDSKGLVYTIYTEDFASAIGDLSNKLTNSINNKSFSNLL
jgi:hypothetical protein